ncbi:furin-like [Orbicella faveolata]|uniref:furin-like n=1 Tax=Orbicella faveolata TaxID=48498 RepID=UPI0009E60C72|nr:furin-like [Orbicella faveolata]
MAMLKLSPFILLVFYNVAGCSSVYTNTWAVKMLCYEPCVRLEGLARKHGFENLSQVVSNYYTFDHKLVPTGSKYPSTDVSTELLAEAEILWAEQQVLQNYKLYSSHGEVIFNDPKWKDQWYMMRDNGPTYNVLDVWKMGYTGRGVVVGVVDDGLQKDHPELKDNYDPDASFDFLENDEDPSPSGSQSHGIRCAGIISAVANNSFCGVGIAYSANIGGECRLYPIVIDFVNSSNL